MKHPDFPFDDVVKTAMQQVRLGNTIHQKFTCAHCGARQTMEEPNKFYRTGQCEECRKVTNIYEQGCNYMLVINHDS